MELLTSLTFRLDCGARGAVVYWAGAGAFFPTERRAEEGRVGVERRQLAFSITLHRAFVLLFSVCGPVFISARCLMMAERWVLKFSKKQIHLSVHINLNCDWFLEIKIIYKNVYPTTHKEHSP